MKAARASIRYAKAFLEFAIENQKEKSVIEEMKNILSLVESSPQLDEALNSPILPGSQKRKVINQVFPKASKIKAKKSRDHTELLFKHLNIPIKINNFDFFAEVTHIEKILDHRAHWVVFKLGSYNSKEYAQKLSGFIEENERYEISLNDGLNFGLVPVPEGLKDTPFFTKLLFGFRLRLNFFLET